VETPAPPSNPLRELAAKLNAEKEADPAEKPAEGDPPKKPAAKAKPKDLTTLAETLGVEVKDLYDLEIPSTREGAEPFTLGKLKDLAAEQDAFTVRSLQHDETVRRKEAEFIRAEQELQTLLAALPKDALKPEVRKAVQDRLEETVKVERTRTLEAIPEWADEKLRTEELKGMVEFLKDYGFSDTYLLRNFDHRTMRFVRAFWQQTVKLRKALGEVTERTPSKTPSKSGPPAARSKPKSNGIQTPQQREVSAFEQTLRNAR
jgi:hypothetical protein